MAFLVNLGYKFGLEPSIHPAGSMILAITMPMHQLQRRRLLSYPHLTNRLFDPQLYLALLEASASPNHCSLLASYPWFGVTTQTTYDSGVQTQSQWRAAARRDITRQWLGQVLTDPTRIAQTTQACIEFQETLGCSVVILPSPLTLDINSDYATELLWLDSGLNYVRSRQAFPLPVFATVALSDLCVRGIVPPENPLLAAILDSVSAREIDGVYIVLEQASEPGDSRQCGSARALASILHLVYHFVEDSHLRVGVNFLGAFGMACLAAGAEFWASGWYKSLYRCRLADKLAAGRAYPSYWAYPAAADIHLDRDFDFLVRANMLNEIAEPTAASDPLLRAAGGGIPVGRVGAWRYASANVTAAQDHFTMSCVAQDARHSSGTLPTRVAMTRAWLDEAVNRANRIATRLGPSAATKTSHVQAWREAFTSFQADNSL